MPDEQAPLTPDEARELDAALQRIRLCGVIATICTAAAAALIYALGNVALPVIVLIAISQPVVWGVVIRSVTNANRSRLAPFIDPVTCQLSIPGGRDTVTVSQVARSIFWDKRESRVMFGGLAACLLIIGGYLLAR